MEMVTFEASPQGSADGCGNYKHKLEYKTMISDRTMYESDQCGVAEWQQKHLLWADPLRSNKQALANRRIMFHQDNAKPNSTEILWSSDGDGDGDGGGGVTTTMFLWERRHEVIG